MRQYSDVVAEERELSKGLAALRELPCETLDGHRMPLWVNTGLLADVARAQERGAEGVGLYRTEVPFMINDRFPSEKEQLAIYREQLSAFHPLPVTMRTLDIGGDKALSYFPIKEDNLFSAGAASASPSTTRRSSWSRPAPCSRPAKDWTTCASCCR